MSTASDRLLCSCLSPRTTRIARSRCHIIAADHNCLSCRRSEAIAATVQTVAPALDVRIVNDKFTGQPRGFAFVHFATIADATRVLHAFNVRVT